MPPKSSSKTGSGFFGVAAVVALRHGDEQDDWGSVNEALAAWMTSGRSSRFSNACSTVKVSE
jgi:hypothetical protein